MTWFVRFPWLNQFLENLKRCENEAVRAESSTAVAIPPLEKDTALSGIEIISFRIDVRCLVDRRKFGLKICFEQYIEAVDAAAQSILVHAL
jgi:hypothetical protein